MRHHLFGERFGVGYEHQAAACGQLLDDLGAHKHVGVVGLFGLVGAAVAGGEEQDTFVVAIHVAFAKDILEVVLKIVGILFRAHNEHEVAVGELFCQRGAHNGCEAARKTFDVEASLAFGCLFQKPCDNFAVMI